MPRPLPTHVLEATGGGEPDAVRAHLLAATLRVIEAQGLAGASTRAIAAEAEVGAGTLYNYFDDRLQLLARAILFHTHELAEPIGRFAERAGTATVAKNLRAFAKLVDTVLAGVVPLMGAAFAEPELLATLRQEMAADDPSVMGARVLTDYLVAERELGRVRPDADCTAAASIVVSLCHDLAFQRYLFGHGGRSTVPARELDLVVAALS
jgi:AcrR family transcriptional regulator